MVPFSTIAPGLNVPSSSHDFLFLGTIMGFPSNRVSFNKKCISPERGQSVCGERKRESNICFTLQNHINQNDNGKETRKSLPAQRVPWNWLPLPDVVTCPRVGVVVVSVRVGWWVYVRWIHYLRSHHKRLTSVQLCYWRLRRGDLVLHWTAVLGMRPTANG